MCLLLFVSSRLYEAVVEVWAPSAGPNVPLSPLFCIQMLIYTLIFTPMLQQILKYQISTNSSGPYTIFLKVQSETLTCPFN